jgi:hypothetical protein
MQSSVGNRGKDPVAKGGMMLVRIGFLVALVLGLGLLLDVLPRTGVREVHMLAGVLVLVGIWIAAIRLSGQKRQGMGPVWGAAVLALVGAAMGILAMLGKGSGIMHMVVMLVTIGLAEMGVGRANKA